jgi:16S rRNA (guanine(966)-N(2))-methyltransferase RsmD
MRVVAGKYRGRLLRTVRGQDVRPTSDRLRETLFNILAPQIKETRFLDLCAGSGAIGIEAISRGANQVTFVEESRSACSVIRDNLATLGIEGQSIVCRDVASAIRSLASKGAEFDIIFFDPPYPSGMYSRVLKLIARENLLSEDGVVVVEHRSKTPPGSEFEGLVTYRQLKQGESALSFMRRGVRSEESRLQIPE